MTEFEIKHGLSQDAPGPLEPVAVAASPVSTVEQRGVQDELTRDRIEEIAREVYKVERFTKDDEVWHNLFWLTSFAKAIEKELRPAPAAGDARDAERYRWLRGKSAISMGYADFGLFSTRKRDSDFLSREEGLQALDAAIDAAIDAQRKGDA